MPPEFSEQLVLLSIGIIRITHALRSSGYDKESAEADQVNTTYTYDNIPAATGTGAYTDADDPSEWTSFTAPTDNEVCFITLFPSGCFINIALHLLHARISCAEYGRQMKGDT